MSAFKAIAAAILMSTVALGPATACDYGMQKNAESEQRPIAAAPAAELAPPTSVATAVPAPATAATTTQTAEITPETTRQSKAN